MFFVDDLREICQMYYDRVYLCEGQKWDLEREVRKRDYEVQEINKRKQQKQNKTKPKKKKKKKKNGEQCEEKESNRPVARHSFVQPLSQFLSSRCLSLFHPLSVHIYVFYLSFFSLSLSLFLSLSLYLSLSLSLSLFHDVSLGEHVEWLFRQAKNRTMKLVYIFFFLFFLSFGKRKTKRTREQRSILLSPLL